MTGNHNSRLRVNYHSRLCSGVFFCRGTLWLQIPFHEYTFTQRYADILSDAGFKAVFGDRGNKEVLIGLLNVLLPEHRQVKDITYSTTEIEGLTMDSKEARLDLRCVGIDGTRFIVEMQKRMQSNFFKRCISYGAKVYDTGTIKKEKDKYDIAPVYVIAILNGKMPHVNDKDWVSECVSCYSFIEHRTKEFAKETISAIFVELERFDKPLERCNSLLDKWCYAFRHIGKLKSRPVDLEQEIFIKLFESAEIARFDKDKRLNYEHEMYTERDKYAEEEYLKDVARKEGREEGRESERVEIALKLKKRGYSLEDIAEDTGLTIQQIVEL